MIPRHAASTASASRSSASAAAGVATARGAGRRRRDGRRLGRQAGRASPRRAAAGIADRRPARSPTGASFAALVLAPGVPLTHPEPHWTVRAREAAGVEIIGDIELFCRERRRTRRRAVRRHHRHQRQVDDDGADRPSSSQSAGRDVAARRQYRHARSCRSSRRRAGRYLRHRVSSFQIDLAPSSTRRRRPAQLTPDHLDRHGTMRALRRDQGAAGRRQPTTAVVGVDDAWCAGDRRPRSSGPARRVIRVSARRPLADGVYAERRRASDRSPSGAATPVADLAGIGSLRGAHNCAERRWRRWPPCRALGLDDGDDPSRAARAFPGLPHRMEEVGRRGRVLFVNDSKATNADAARQGAGQLRAASTGSPAAGRRRAASTSLRRLLPAHRQGLSDRRGGATAFAATLGEAVPLRDVGHARRGGRRRRRAMPRSDRGAEPVVLLSPACASYDQFTEFRGARRRLPRARACSSMASPAKGRQPDGQPRRSQPVRRVVVDGRQLVCSAALVVADAGPASCCRFAGSPAVAERLGYDSFHFVKRQSPSSSRRWR